MRVLTIKAKNARAQNGNYSFVHQVREKTFSLLAEFADQVLIVYGKEGANIYCEASLPRPPRV